MFKDTIDRMTELNQIYNELGEDLLLMESVIIASRLWDEFPPEYIASGLRRVADYTDQHLADIRCLTGFLQRSASMPGAPEAMR